MKEFLTVVIQKPDFSIILLITFTYLVFQVHNFKLGMAVYLN